MPKKEKRFLYTDSVDTFSAKSPEHLAIHVCEHYGWTMDDYCAEVEEVSYRVIPDDKEVVVHYDLSHVDFRSLVKSNLPASSAPSMEVSLTLVVSATAREWADVTVGFLCSTEH